MKIKKISALIALLTVCYLHSPAQGSTPPINEPNPNRTKVFSDMPEKLNVNLTDMDALLQLPVGAQVNSGIAQGFRLAGTVVSKSNPADKSVKSIVIKTSSRQQAMLTFSRITAPDGSVSYIGRMMSKNAGDAMEIVKEGNGYIMRKKGFYDMINE